MSQAPRLLLLDGTSVVRRVYEAVPGDDSPSRVEGALSASLHSIMRSLKEHQPTHFLAAFDAGGKTWRHGLMPEFKANRPQMYQGLRDNMPVLFSRLDDHKFAWACAEGVEADDVIATIAKKAVHRGFEVIVASNDIDMCVLLADGVKVYGHFSKEWRGLNWLSRVHGIAPHQIPDYLAMIGDEGKGIRGVPGVGTSRAKAMLNEYGDLETILEHIMDITGKFTWLMRTMGEELLLWRNVLRLKFDCPVSIRPAELALPNRTREPKAPLATTTA